MNTSKPNVLDTSPLVTNIAFPDSKLSHKGLTFPHGQIASRARSGTKALTYVEPFWALRYR
jgi:hypothetical protein